jgi:hypothetical protein
VYLTTLLNNIDGKLFYVCYIGINDELSTSCIIGKNAKLSESK